MSDRAAETFALSPDWLCVCGHTAESHPPLATGFRSGCYDCYCDRFRPRADTDRAAETTPSEAVQTGPVEASAIRQSAASLSVEAAETIRTVRSHFRWARETLGPQNMDGLSADSLARRALELCDLAAALLAELERARQGERDAARQAAGAEAQLANEYHAQAARLQAVKEAAPSPDEAFRGWVALGTAPAYAREKFTRYVAALAAVDSEPRE